ncbi:MAG: DUF1343 domain-containing protein [Desulfamplus sp.]|nr:DUF1343 domain-containing protein [Desulfamplus sp.]
MLNNSNLEVITGLENLCRNPREKVKKKRLGLLANPASVDKNFRHASNLINQIYPGQLKALFSPQHGFHAEKQDNMIESDHELDPVLKIPIFSLYSNTRIPTKEMFDLIDTLIVDIQDVGTRVYTFIYTISYCLEAAAEYGKEVVILDRPNPLGGMAVEGNLLKKEYASFVGRFPIPMRHGLTVGEIASLFNSKFITGSNCLATAEHITKINNLTDADCFTKTNCSTDTDCFVKTDCSTDTDCFVKTDCSIDTDFFKKMDCLTGKGCDLTVIPMKGWNRNMLFSDTNLPWIPPSPNLPNPYSALVYPGQVIWEGTNVSEGRGTTQPFEIFGAPFINTDKILCAISNQKTEQYCSSDRVHIQGAVLRTIAFQPTSGKWQGEVCRGFQIHVVSPELFKPYKTSLLLLQQIIKHHSDQFRWKEPPYEYEYVKLPIDLILGDKALRESIQNLENLDTIEASWQKELDEFKKISREFYLYA